MFQVDDSVKIKDTLRGNIGEKILHKKQEVN